MRNESPAPPHPPFNLKFSSFKTNFKSSGRQITVPPFLIVSHIPGWKGAWGGRGAVGDSGQSHQSYLLAGVDGFLNLSMSFLLGVPDPPLCFPSSTQGQI